MRPLSAWMATLIGLFRFAGFAAGANGFVDLFNGSDVAGWVQRGGSATYAVVDGVLVGESVLGIENSFLCPPGEYGNFLLEYDFKIDSRLNSGVQIRSRSFDYPVTISLGNGTTITVPANRVHGYQIEIDNDPVRQRWWSAGLYEEGARGWIYPGLGGGDPIAFTQQGETITLVDDWNHVQVEAMGNRIRTWLNGQLRVDVTDPGITSGFFGFQVHAIGTDTSKVGAKVLWRNIRVSPINTAPQISPVSGRTVDEGMPLTLGLSGTDSDVPAQMLSYALVSGPAGMTVTPGGLVSWTPTETQGGATVTVHVQVTDSGVPPLSATNSFQVVVRDVPQLDRTVWQLGVDAPTGSSGAVSYAEFTIENSINDLAPGRVTRLAGDPLYVDAASNPRVDDDYYFGGVYPAGFNGLTSLLSVPNDEPFSAWERAHTLRDRTNRIHFLLGAAQATGTTQYRLRVDLATGGSRIGAVFQPGFSTHDYLVRFRNGAGVTTLVYSNRLTQVTNLLIEFTAAQVAATLGANSLELARSGPTTATDYWLTYDQVRLEVVPINTPPQINPVSGRTVDEGIPLTLNLSGSDADVPAQTLSYALVSGPVGMTVTPGGLVSWTPTETQGGGAETVHVMVTDNGVPPLSATNTFQVVVRDVPQLGRTVWQLGVDAPTGSSGAVSYAEFSIENSLNDPAPGRVTRLPGDPVYVDAASNPRADDDYYFGGVYPAGFNGLSSLLSAPNDEPFSAWERAHTLRDRTNRIHFLLGAAQVAGATQDRLRVDLATGGSRIGAVVQPGFSAHDYLVQFRNGAGVTTLVYSNHLTQVTNLLIDFTAAQVTATLGANSLEFVRSGPATATDYWLTYDQVRLEVALGASALSGAAPATVADDSWGSGTAGTGALTCGRIPLEGVEYLTLTYGYMEPLPEGVSYYRVEVTSDLVHWTSAEVVVHSDVLHGGWRAIVVRDLTPLGVGSRRFLRVRAVSASEPAATIHD